MDEVLKGPHKSLSCTTRGQGSLPATGAGPPFLPRQVGRQGEVQVVADELMHQPLGAGLFTPGSPPGGENAHQAGAARIHSHWQRTHVLLPVI